MGEFQTHFLSVVVLQSFWIFQNAFITYKLKAYLTHQQSRMKTDA